MADKLTEPTDEFFFLKIHISCLEFLQSLLVVVQNESVKKIKEVDPPSVY